MLNWNNCRIIIKSGHLFLMGEEISKFFFKLRKLIKESNACHANLHVCKTILHTLVGFWQRKILGNERGPEFAPRASNEAIFLLLQKKEAEIEYYENPIRSQLRPKTNKKTINPLDVNKLLKANKLLEANKSMLTDLNSCKSINSLKTNKLPENQ